MTACKAVKDAEAAYDVFQRVVDAKIEPDEVFMKMLNDILMKAGRNDLRKSVHQYFTEQENRLLIGDENADGDDVAKNEKKEGEEEEDEEGDDDDEEGGDVAKAQKRLDSFRERWKAGKKAQKEDAERKKELKVSLQEAERRRRKIIRLKKEGYKSKWVRNEAGDWVEEFPLEEIEAAEKEVKEKQEKLKAALAEKVRKRKKAAEEQRKFTKENEKYKYNTSGFIKAKMVTTNPVQEW